MTNLNSSNLEFFNSLSGRLRIKLTEPAGPGVETMDVQLCAHVFEEEKQDFRDLTKEELDLVVFQGPHIRLRGESGDIVEHKAPNDESFTAEELLAAVEETERRTRGNSEWFGGVDVHHVYFEGIYQDEDGVWGICWGS